MGEIADWHIEQFTSGRWAVGSYRTKTIKPTLEEFIMAKREGTKVITNEARMSYANVWEPKAIEGNEPKYSVAVLIPKSDTDTIKKINEAIEAAKQEGKAKWNGKIPGNLKTPLRDGDEERPDDETYAGHYFFNATSKNKPGIVKKGVGAVVEITDEDEFYSGCYGKVSVNFYPFNANGNRGIAAGLQNLFKTRDGERLAGGASAESDFADEVDNDFNEDEDLLD